MDGGCHERRERRLDELPSLHRHLEGISYQRLGRRRAETHDNPWMQQRNLSIEPRAARANLPGLRLRMDAALAPRLPFEVFHHVRDVNPFARNPRLPQSLLEHTPCGPDERMARQIFVVAGLLADEHHLRRRRSFTKN